MERCVILHFTLTLSFTFRHILLIAMDKYSFICINAADGVSTFKEMHIPLYCHALLKSGSAHHIKQFLKGSEIKRFF